MIHWPVDPAVYASFLLIMGGMAVSPGPANLFALATGLASGPRAGLMGVLGMNIASLFWFVCAALGLGVLMKLFPTVFALLAVAGGLYLAWLGFKAVRSALDPQMQGFSLSGKGAGRNPLKDGFIVQFSNPKALLFFTAVLPPFVDQAKPIIPQLILFAAATVTFDVLAMSVYALMGGLLAVRFSDPRFARVFSAIVGLVLLGTAALMLLRTQG
jgi:threonine/homoserine/homoserine lactone efflux protein